MRSLLGAALTAWVLMGTASGELREVEPGVLVDNFEDGVLGRIGVDGRETNRQSRLPETLKIVKEGRDARLHLKGGSFHNRAYYLGREFEDFSLEVRMKRTSGSYVGVVVRDHWRVYLQKRGFLGLNTDLKAEKKRGTLFKSSERFVGYHTLRVVCAGPLLRVYVDGEPIVSRRIPLGKGRIGFYSHGGGEAYYEHVRLETKVEPALYLYVEPRSAEPSLVFAPDQALRLPLQISNASPRRQTVTTTATVMGWDGAVVLEGVTQQETVEAGGEATVELDMGPIAAGFYRLDLEGSADGKPFWRRDRLPLAVQERGQGTYSAPAIPVAAYYRYENSRTPLEHNTYAHAIARSLREHNFNTVVADSSFNRHTVDILQSYGLATITRSGKFLDHPAAIASLVGDEPTPDEIESLKQQYQKLRQTTDKPLTTCLVGDALGLGKEGGPLWIWRQLNPHLRSFRWYGIKKSFYGLLHDVKYKPYLPLSSVLRIAEASSATPYWVVLPALGKTQHEAYYQAPSPAEVQGMMHLSLAYGADGLIFFAYQSHKAGPCFVDQVSLEPSDGKYAAAAEVAGTIQRHAELIRSLEPGGLDVRCTNPGVDAVPRKSTRDGRHYVYLVNKDTRNAVSTRLLLWAERWEVNRVRDVFSGRELAMALDEEGHWSLALDLEPGEGQLLLADVTDRKPSKEGRARAPGRRIP